VIETRQLQGRAALAAAMENGDQRDFARIAERAGRRLRRDKLPFARALALLLLAGAANLRGDADSALRHLQEAVERCEETDMALYAAAARRRLGQVLGGDEGAALVEEAEQWMRGQGIVRPDRWTAMLAPGFV